MQKLNTIYQNRFLFILCIPFFYCCKENKFYYHHILNDKYTTIIEGEIKRGLENGYWTISTADGNKLGEGCFNNGIKTGKWIYNYKDSLFSVEWRSYSNEALRINIPEPWIVIEHEDELFQATFDTKSNIKSNKYLIIGCYNSDSIGIELDEYFMLSKRNLAENSEIIKSQNFIIKNGEDQYFFSIYHLHKNSEEILVFNFIRGYDNFIIDIGYSSLDTNVKSKVILFYDVLCGCFYNDVRIIDPFKEINIIPN